MTPPVDPAPVVLDAAAVVAAALAVDVVAPAVFVAVDCRVVDDAPGVFVALSSPPLHAARAIVPIAANTRVIARVRKLLCNSLDSTRLANSCPGLKFNSDGITAPPAF